MTVSGVLLDIAGVLVDGHALVPGALEAVALLRGNNVPFRLVSNTSRRPKRDVIDQLRDLASILPQGICSPVQRP